MPLTLRELLGFEVLREARPEVLVGETLLERPVRWVHSSEIYEIGPLLFGGELLLTTGLGLAGPDAGARRHYVRELAARRVAGLALELGRTFLQPPEELVAEARRLGLPLVVLHEVVPFIRIAQAANTAIVDRDAARLRLGDEVGRALNDTLAAGAGVGGLLAVAGELTGGPLVLLSAAGALVAAYGVGDHREAWSTVDVARHIVPVAVHGKPWGRLLAGPGSAMPDDDLAAVLDRIAGALALAVLLTGSPPSDRDLQAAALLGDLAEQAVPTEADYRLRAGMVGFHVSEGQQVVAIAVDGPESGPALAMLARAARGLGTSWLAGRVVGAVVALLVAPATAKDPVGVVQAAVEDARRRTGAQEVTAAVGHAVPGPGAPGEVSGTLRAARAALRLAVGDRAARPRGAAVVTSTRALALELELTRDGADPERLRRLARATIGPLADWDAAHRTELVRTLEVLLRHGGSPTRAAAALQLGRQSLYQRIERIESLLGHPVDDPALHTSLLVAACAHRLSTP